MEMSTGVSLIRTAQSLLTGRTIAFMKEFFEKVNFEKMSADDNKSMKYNAACNQLNIQIHCTRNQRKDSVSVSLDTLDTESSNV